MKIQIINKSQQKKLLELCKEFFPEYNEIRFGEVGGQGDNQKKESVCQFIWLEKDFYYNHDSDYGRSETQVISWYQLCLTELPKRIWSNIKKTKSEECYSGSKGEYALNNLVTSFGEYKYHQNIGISYKEDLQGLINYCTFYHPVDFLWDFVQECKKNKYFKN